MKEDANGNHDYDDFQDKLRRAATGEKVYSVQRESKDVEDELAQQEKEYIESRGIDDPSSEAQGFDDLHPEMQKEYKSVFEEALDVLGKEATNKLIAMYQHDVPFNVKDYVDAQLRRHIDESKGHGKQGDDSEAGKQGTTGGSGQAAAVDSADDTGKGATAGKPEPKPEPKPDSKPEGERPRSGAGSDAVNDNKTTRSKAESIQMIEQIATSVFGDAPDEYFHRAADEINRIISEYPNLANNLRRFKLSVIDLQNKKRLQGYNDAGGRYNREFGNNRIEMPVLAAKSQKATLTPKKQNVGNDFETYLRHEIGHHVYTAKATKDRNEAAFKENARKVSIYATQNPDEFFSEAFAAYTSPLYKQKPFLSPEVEKMLSIVAYGAAIQKSVPDVSHIRKAGVKALCLLRKAQ